MTKERCEWCLGSDLMVAYHDNEWGVPVHDDRKLFEFMVLDAFQAGLSWSTILNKRENFRQAFDDFDPNKIARYTSRKVEGLLQDVGIVRNRMKVEATVANAKTLLQIQKEGSFDDLIWGFVDGKPIQNAWASMKGIPVKTAESDEMSKTLKKMGFKFVGSTICYAFMQAAGLVNDHKTSCFRFKPLGGKARRTK
jgi:DNA-3-methyladenine glycosylase I